MVRPPAFRRWFLFGSMLPEKFSRRPPPPFGLRPSGGGGRSHMYLNPDSPPKIRVRDFFWGGFCRNPGRGEILAFAAAMPGGFADGTRPKRAEERNRGERSMTVRNAPGCNRFFCRARDAFFCVSGGYGARAIARIMPTARRTASRPALWHGARSCRPCSRAGGERSRCASTRSSHPAPGASARTG